VSTAVGLEVLDALFQVVDVVDTGLKRWSDSILMSENKDDIEEHT
jgi:hypothetical protein